MNCSRRSVAFRVGRSIPLPSHQSSGAIARSRRDRDDRSLDPNEDADQPPDDKPWEDTPECLPDDFDFELEDEPEPEPGDFWGSVDDDEE